MNKQITFNSEARSKLKKGIDILANAVKVTLGPNGKTVIIEEGQIPHITKDGVTVAKSINLPDPVENLGVQLVKSVSAKTGTDAGDGTTTATVLAQAIINFGLKIIESGANPIDVKRGMTKASEIIIDYIKNHSIDVDYDKIEQVATISANNDPEIGKLIANAMKQVSMSGVITLEESKTSETSIEKIEGTQFDCGFVSSYFINNQDRNEVLLTNARILILNSKLTKFKTVQNLILTAIQEERQFLFVVNDVDTDVLNTLIANRINANARICVVKAPYFGERRKSFLQDLAIITGGLVINSEDDIPLIKNLNPVLGFAKKIIVQKSETTIIDGKFDKSLKDKYINDLVEKKSLLTSELDKQDLQERINNLKGGVAVIYVGANSEIEMLEKKDRIDDALCATRAAISEGVVIGGGTTYIHSIQNFDRHFTNLNFDELSGVNIIVNAVQVPLKQICANGNISGDVIINQILKSQSLNIGYNAKSNKIENLLESGVIDPAKVVRSALENAVSVASTFLTTECAITNLD